MKEKSIGLKMSESKELAALSGTAYRKVTHDSHHLQLGKDTQKGSSYNRGIMVIFIFS